MPSDNEKLHDICNTVHTIMQLASKGLLIPVEHEARVVRKKISVFTYGLITELSKQEYVNNKLDVDVAYTEYLKMGGLNKEQAAIVAKRTRDEFSDREFGQKCLHAAENVFAQWKLGNKDIKPYLEALL